MKSEELNLMKYGDLWKIAKKKFNITRRMSKEKLIKKLLQQHENHLLDERFISADESTDNSTVDSEVLQESAPRRGRKRGKQQNEEQKKTLPVTKKAKKGSVEHALNSTFSVDEEENGYQNAKNVVDSTLIKEPQETIFRTLRGRKKVYLTEETSANESENEKVSTRKLKKSGKVDPKNQTFANSDGEKSMMEKIHSSANGDSVLKSPAHELEPKKISKGKLKKSASAAVRYLSEESEAEQVPANRTRGSSKAESTEQTVMMLNVANDDESQLLEPVAQNETECNDRLTTSFVVSSETKVPVSTPSVVTGKKAVLLRTSSHPVRNRKPTTISSTPAKITVTSTGSAKKVFTASSETNHTPKLGKPKAAPNFAEIHQKNFLKMQSVDEYVEKKRNRTETMAASVKIVRAKSVLNNTVTPQAIAPPKSKAAMQDISTTPVAKDIKFNFVSGLQKPVFTAKGQVVNEKQRVVARVKENLQNNVSQIPAATTSIGKRKASMLNVSRDINTSKLSLAGKQILELQMQHRNMKN